MTVGLLLAAAGLATGQPPEVRAAADAANRFTCDLYAEARGTPGGLFLSPFGVQQAFAMLADGAAGDTRAELVKAFHLPADPAAVGALGRAVAAPGKSYELRVANALWGQKGYPWRPGFADGLRARFAAGAFVHDFRSAPEAGRTAVNDWVAAQTAGRIRDLLPDGAVDDRTRLVLANAVYFNAKWATEFKPADTRPESFTRADGSKAPVPLMRHKNDYRHAQMDGFQVLELPYAGGDLGIMVALPADPAGLPAVEARLTADALTGWVKKLDERPVELSLPRFTLTHAPDLRALLRAVGLTRAFDKKQADLSRLITELPPEDGPLYVSGAYHKALVEVSETGTVAAAVSSGVIGANLPGPAPREPVVFRADRPFLFLIRDVKHGTVLFVGRYAGP